MLNSDNSSFPSAKTLCAALRIISSSHPPATARKNCRGVLAMCHRVDSTQTGRSARVGECRRRACKICTLSARGWQTGTLASALMLKGRISSNPLKRTEALIHPLMKTRCAKGRNSTWRLKKWYVQKHHAARLVRHKLHRTIHVVESEAEYKNVCGLKFLQADFEELPSWPEVAWPLCGRKMSVLSGSCQMPKKSRGNH